MAVSSIGLHTTLSTGTGSPLVYTAIANVVSIDGPNMEVGTVDTTVLASTSKSYLPTLPDGGEVSLTLNFDSTDTGHQALEGYIWTPAIVHWKIAQADGGAWTFDGILTNLGNKYEVESVITADATIKVTGAVTFAHS